MNAQHGCYKKQKPQSSAVTSDGLIIQNKDTEKVESLPFYRIPNQNDASKTIQRGET